MSFRKTHIVLHEAGKTVIKGYVSYASRYTSTIEASVQPVKEDDVSAKEYGKRWSDIVKLYADADLNVPFAESSPADIVVFEGYGYEIVDKMPYKFDSAISHTKYIARKTLKFTSEADWISGVTQRYSS